MSATQVLNGWCYLCNTSVDIDVQAHFNQEHQSRATKPKVPMLSWQHRLDQVVVDLGEVRTEENRGRQIGIIDGVLQELYLVRARLAQLKSTPNMKEG